MKNNQLYPTDLTDCQWDCIKDLIPPAKPGGRPRSLEMRAVINAILYLVVTGSQWRMLPREYPAWQSVYSYFRRWRDDGRMRYWCLDLLVCVLSVLLLFGLFGQVLLLIGLV